jgi:hypothetical protein
MSGLSPSQLSLPEQLVLLSYRCSGKVHDSAQTAIGAAAAELALRRRLIVRSRKSRMFGLAGYHLLGAEIQLLDIGRTGLAWADELLRELMRRSDAEHGGVGLARWLRQRRRAALSLHRDALVERGVLRHRPGRVLSLGRSRYYLDYVMRDALIDEFRAVYSGQSRLSEHMLILGGLVKAAG